MPEKEPDSSDYKRLEARIQKLEAALDKSQVSLEDGLDGQHVTYTTNPTVGATDGVDHTLKRVPKGYIITSKSGAVNISKATTPWSSSKIFLKADAAGVSVSMLVF